MGSSPGPGEKGLLCLKEGEGTLRGIFVLSAFNASLGATMIVEFYQRGCDGFIKMMRITQIHISKSYCKQHTNKYVCKVNPLF